MSNGLVINQGYMIRVNGSARKSNEKDLVTYLAPFLETALQLKNGLLALSFLSLQRSKMLKQSYTILEAFENSRKHKNAGRALCQ